MYKNRYDVKHPTMVDKQQNQTNQVAMNLEKG